MHTAEGGDWQKPPAGVDVAMSSGDVERPIQLDEQIAEVAGVLARTYDAWLLGHGVKFVVAHKLHFGVDTRVVDDGLDGLEEGGVADFQLLELGGDVTGAEDTWGAVFASG